MDRHSVAANEQCHLLAKVCNKLDEVFARLDALDASLAKRLPLPKPGPKQASE